jgi:hypothetical protein
MSIDLNLHIAVLANHYRPSDQDLQRLLKFVPFAFADGSGRDIKLNARVSSVPFGDLFGGTVDNLALHEALEMVTGRQRRRTQVKNIGLLIADRYKHGEDYFGLMFDDQFDPASFNPYLTTPREGCAIFLGGISDRRKGEDFRDEMLFTAIHEIGHVFNLQHVNEPSFMAISAWRPQPFPEDNFQFSHQHKSLLAQCSTQKYIWPGGSGFGVLGDLAVANAPNLSSVASPELKLHLNMVQREFWYFEPVELDLSIELTDRSIKSIQIPDLLDPGCDEFDIWMDEPDGERRRYRSPQRYCGRQRMIEIRPDKPKTRDLSIFGGAGGYTFRKAGVHRIYATFDIRNRSVLQSNTLEVNVLPSTPGKSYFEAAKACFTDRNVARIMFYRSFSGSKRHGLKRILDFTELYTHQPSAGMALYALGRAMTSRLRRADPSSATRRQTRDTLKSLCNVVGNIGISEHRKSIVEDEIKFLETFE